MRTPTGLEVRLYPNVVEFHDADEAHVLSMTPEEYGMVMRWIEAQVTEAYESEAR